MVVGQGGAGALLVNGGAGIDSLGSADVISGTGSAQVTVDGAGSEWTSANELIVGSAGTGDLIVSNQGQVRTGGSPVAGTPPGFEVAESAGAAAAITVTGTNSVLTNTGAFVVGDAGNGNLTVEAGGTVITAPGTRTEPAGWRSRTRPVSTPGSTSRTGADLPSRAAGCRGEGSAGLQVSGGATVTATTLDAANGGSAVAQISVSDPGSELSITNGATVADDGTGVLSVLNGASSPRGR